MHIGDLGEFVDNRVESGTRTHSDGRSSRVGVVVTPYVYRLALAGKKLLKNRVLS